MEIATRGGDLNAMRRVRQYLWCAGSRTAGAACAVPALFVHQQAAAHVRGETLRVPEENEGGTTTPGATPDSRHRHDQNDGRTRVRARGVCGAYLVARRVLAAHATDRYHIL